MQVPRLDDLLDGITDRIAPIELGALQFVRRDTYEVVCNWKVYVDNYLERDVAFSDRVQEEDITICEHVQRGLQSKAYDRGRFSVEMEAGVYHFQRLLKRAYRRAADA